MQAIGQWTDPSGVLGTLVAEAHRRVAFIQGSRVDLERRAAAAPPARGFEAALRLDTVALICEIKRRSPSKGEVGGSLDLAAHAQAFAAGGAAALSILTEPSQFGGSLDDLAAARAAVELPLIRKDFHVDPIQLLEARALGADAALLIARALSPDALVAMVAAARDLELEVLVEVRDERELDRALTAGATLIGVNNRNLETLAIDLATGDRVVPLIPARCVAVYESGVAGRDDVERAARAGAAAVLVGSSISAAADPVAAVRTLSGVRRRDGAAGR